jgi:putative ABC transport system ATP-binding protein
MNEERASATGAATLLELDGVDVSVREKHLMTGCAFSLRAGELLGFSGPSGCGKSTLLRMIAALIDCGGGRICFRGKTPDAWGWPQYRGHVLLVAQQPALLDAPVLENLARPFSYASNQGDFCRDEARRILAALGLKGEVLGQGARSLSVGEQQRVALCRALLLKPSVLLLDEPASGLDAVSVAAMGRLLREEAETRGLAALVVSHDGVVVEGWCDRVIHAGAFAGKEACHG